MLLGVVSDRPEVAQRCLLPAGWRFLAVCWAASRDRVGLNVRVHGDTRNAVWVLFVAKLFRSHGSLANGFALVELLLAFHHRCEELADVHAQLVRRAVQVRLAATAARAHAACRHEHRVFQVRLDVTLHGCDGKLLPLGVRLNRGGLFISRFCGVGKREGFDGDYTALGGGKFLVSARCCRLRCLLLLGFLRLLVCSLRNSRHFPPNYSIPSQ